MASTAKFDRKFGTPSRGPAPEWQLRDLVSGHKQHSLLPTGTKRRTGLTVEFRCIFGISSPIKELVPGEQVNALFDGFTIITIHGKNGRVYWLVIQKLDKKYTYPNCPRYMTSDIEIAAEELRSIVFYKDLTFGHLWETRETVSMTALEENTFETWYHDRLVLLGDSAHKMTPNIGQGANMAIEDAAVLANLLQSLRKGLGTWPPTDGQLQTLLEQYRSIRYGRVNSVYKSSRFLVRLHARDGLLKTLFGRYYVPYAGNLPAHIGSKSIADGVLCDFLPPPMRSGGGWERYRTKDSNWRWVPQATLYVLVFAILYTYMDWVPGLDSVESLWRGLL